LAGRWSTIIGVGREGPANYPPQRVRGTNKEGMTMATATVTSKVVTEVALTREAVTLDADTLAIVTKFIETRDMLRTLEKEKKEMEALLKEAMGDAEVGLTPDGEVRLEASKRERKGIDQKQLAEAFPEAFEACQTATQYVVLVAK